jgi:hypothetical protein
VIQRRSDVLWREIDGNIVGLDLRSSRYFSLNGTASMLWQMLDREAEPQELADALVRTHQIEDDRARVDVDAFVTSLRENGLLQG